MAAAFRQDPSSTGVFKALGKERPVSVGEGRRAVVIGGGTGAPISIRTLLSMGFATDAVVAMADDGGSTGILRQEAHVTPPGDVRKCLAAFAGDLDDPLTRAFKYRFDFARNHTLGNLMLSALEDATGSFPEAIDICERLLHARGHVYPSTLDLITLEAETRDGEIVAGQAKASRSTTALKRVWLRAAQDCAAYPPAAEAILQADLIVLGPGSLFTSIIPNLLVPGMVDALRESRGKTVFVCSLADMQGETWGLSAYEHVEALLDHGMRGLLDYVFIHSEAPLQPKRVVDEVYGGVFDQGASVPPAAPEAGLRHTIRPVPVSYADLRAIQEEGPVAVARNMVDPRQPTWHDPRALREAFAGMMKPCRSPRM